MDDIYGALMGEAPTDQAKVAELASALRRRRGYGELGMLTGDRILGGVGKNLVSQADDYASQFQDNRQKDIDNRQTAYYQGAQINHMGNSLKQALDIARMNDETQRRGQDLSYRAALERAQRMGNKPKNLTYSDRNKLEGMANDLNNVRSLSESFSKDYTQRLGPGPQSKLPNTLASVGIGTEGSKKAAGWWADWAKLYTLPQRNATFGATLTATEKQAWAEADINPSMSEEQIRRNVAKVEEIFRNKAALAEKTYKAQGFDPQMVDSYGLDESNEAPQPGDVQDGYVFQGGDPADPANWVPEQ